MLLYKQLLRQVLPLFLIAFFSLQFFSASAQVSITYDESNSSFASYNETFESNTTNKLPTQKGIYPYSGVGMASAWDNGGLTTQSTIRGWYLGVENQDIRRIYLIGNDSTVVASSAYSYGANSSAERAIGFKGQAGQQGVFYAALRMKNNSTRIIKNFDVSFAIEQWYYGGEVSDVHLEYAIGPNVISATTTSVSWYPIDLIQTPINSGLERTANGNKAENRVAKTLSLENVNIPAGQEIVFRWAIKITSSHTKFNGVALDDVTVRPHGIGQASDIPETRAITYYNIPGKPLDDTRSWGINPDGSGTNPRNFTDPEQTFLIKNLPSKINGIKYKYREDDFTVSIKAKEGWVVSGENSKVVLGDGVVPVKMAIHKSKFYSGPLDIAANATLVINTDKLVSDKVPTFGTLNPASTVVYSDSTNFDIANTTYGNLVILGNAYSKSKIKHNKLSSPLSISGKLELDGKKLNLADKLLTMKEGGSLISADTASYVIAEGAGALYRTVPAGTTNEVVFPVGTSKAVSPVKVAGSNIAMAYKVSLKPSITSPLNHNGTSQRVASDHTWVIEKEQLSGGSPTATISIQWKDSDRPSDEYDAEKMYVGRYNAETDQWELKKAAAYKLNMTTGLHEITFTDDFNAAVDATTPGAAAQTTNALQAAYTSQAVAAQTFNRNEVAVFTSVQPFPVELSNFTAAHSQGVTKLFWRTATEINNSHFEVEFGSSLTDFKKVGEVKGQGNSSIVTNYSFAHKNSFSGTIYYRLKQVDLNGEVSYSKTVAVEAQQHALQELLVAPNPTSGRVTVQLPSEEEHTLTIINTLGKVMAEVNAPANREQMELDFSSYPDGTYIVSVQGKNGMQTYKLIKY
ncbi:T9SS type A sorting domain-containing protein [Pontibacter sp. H249]|uniref:T9SS type A sorting domain-containing protein n=1 Tax=Pontibacter sp. H249 TaxID=3133420 RepID=UPI0030BB657D